MPGFLVRVRILTVADGNGKVINVADVDNKVMSALMATTVMKQFQH